MFREIMMSSYMASMSGSVGTTCDMGKEGRSAMDIGGGWTEHERPDGKKFYVNNTTGKRTWARPTEGVVSEDQFQRCGGYVKKMVYEGRYPRGMKTVADDGYDCETFLSKLYDMNEEKWEKSLGQTPGEALPVFQHPMHKKGGHGGAGGHAAGHHAHGAEHAGEEPLIKPMDRWVPRQSPKEEGAA